MITITVNASVKYDVIIGSGLLENCGKYVSSVTGAEKIALITDDNVDGIYSGTVEKSLKESGFDVRKFVFPHGEASKCSDTLNKIYSFLAANHFTRTDCIAALGGGVTGDMAGYASATYLRGMDFIQLPRWIRQLAEKRLLISQREKIWWAHSSSQSWCSVTQVR